VGRVVEVSRTGGKDEQEEGAFEESENERENEREREKEKSERRREER
jgi:hypothetical protein